ncbi:MAG: hypothetical protein P1S60_12560 [Anaerolineae bacterium]|nr:hypothetical protein [Anaerolineae bacterium]
MDHVKILKRAWAILWQYRVLWIFGIILALTTASGSSGSNTSVYNLNRDDFNNNGGNFLPPENLPEEVERFFRGFETSPNWQLVGTVTGMIIALVIALICIMLVLGVIATIAKHVANTALIKLVNDYEETGEKRTFREGFKMGWSKAAVRLFLINLTAAVPIFIVIIVLAALVLAPLLLWTSGNTTTGVIGTITAIGLGFLLIIFLIALGVAVSILLHFVRRASVLEDLGVIDAYKRGFSLLRENLGPILLMWLIMLGIQLGLALVVIPIAVIAVIVSAVFSGLFFLIVWGIASLFLSGAAMWITAGLLTAPVFILVLSIPLAFVGGLIKVYESTVWTLSFREITALKTLRKETDDHDHTVVVDMDETLEQNALAEETQCTTQDDVDEFQNIEEDEQV